MTWSARFRMPFAGAGRHRRTNLLSQSVACGAARCTAGDRLPLITAGTDLDPATCCACVSGLPTARQRSRRGIEQNQLLPLQPAADAAGSQRHDLYRVRPHRRPWLTLTTPRILPVQQQFGTLFVELPDLEPHLRRFLLDCTMLHLGELLKRRTEPWRAFNRWILEYIRSSLADARGDNGGCG